MTRNEYVASRNNNNRFDYRLLYEYHKVFGKKIVDEYTFRNLIDTYRHVFMMQFNHVAMKAIEYFDIQFNIVSLFNREGALVKYY